uniref:Transmembrane protein 229B n=1 Tax=Sinocyclocheilus grahami TaxID=75366 RepID=A0A672QAN9_SINGR
MDILTAITPTPLSLLAQLYIYSLHWCLCELAFTAAWDCLWALLIYSSAIFFMEGLSARLQQKHCPLPVRLTVYTLLIYLWEFSWGFLLRLFGACPWDYSEFRYNFVGLVTLEYAVPWVLAALVAEKHVIRNTLKIRLDNVAHVPLRSDERGRAGERSKQNTGHLLEVQNKDV